MVLIPMLHLNMAHIQAHGGEMDVLPELLRFKAMWCQFSSLKLPNRVMGLGLPALPRHRYLKDEKELKTLFIQISLDSFRHFKGISRHKLVFLNKKIYIIIKPLDHEILFMPNINCRWKIFEQELASTIRQNMNSWTGNISAESREEGDSTSCCCFEKHVIGGMGRKRGGRCQHRADEEYEGNHTVSLYSHQCKAETTGNWESRKREWATQQRWLCRAAAQKRLFDVNQQPSALMVDSSTRLPALMQSLPHWLTLLSQPAQFLHLGYNHGMIDHEARAGKSQVETQPWELLYGMANLGWEMGRGPEETWSLLLNHVSCLYCMD